MWNKLKLNAIETATTMSGIGLMVDGNTNITSYTWEPSHINLPKKYIVNADAAILFWDDGEKTVVKRCEDDDTDVVKAFLWAYFLKHSGLSRTKANKYLKEVKEFYLK